MDMAAGGGKTKALHARTAHCKPRKSQRSLCDVLKPIVGKTKGLPPDASANKDHYLYGVPWKRVARKHLDRDGLTIGQKLVKHAGILRGLPSDMARNHALYNHGPGGK